MENREQNGMAYIMVNVNESGNNVPSLVPYDYSSEEEKEKTSDHSNQFSQHRVKSNVESQSESPKSDSSEDYASCLPDSIFYTSDNESSLDKKDKYREDDSDEDYVPRSPEGYHIWTTNETFDVSFCHGILKDNGCNESSFRFHAVNFPGCFVAYLHKEELERLKGDSRVRNIYRMNTFCED